MINIYKTLNISILSRKFSVLSINDRKYRIPQSINSHPVVVICMDGFDPEYISSAEKHNMVPTLSSFKKSGFYTEVNCNMPSFTNPNNMSIVTGQPPSVHGICGNYFLDRTTGEEIMMNDSKFIQCENTILSKFYQSGLRVGAITAKNKLLSLLSYKMKFNNKENNHPICFSAEGANNLNFSTNGIENINQIIGPAPNVYSAEASTYVLRAGVMLQSKEIYKRDLLYLSTTDYVFHKYGPNEKEALEFIAQIDKSVGDLINLGCVVGLTADHGMSLKADGIIYLEEFLPKKSTVILPITDPYVNHHASLGSFAHIYLWNEEKENKRKVMDLLQKIKGINMVITGDEAAEKFSLPIDRIGDITIISDKGYTIGKAPSKHNLGVLEKPLRSHGGLTERTIPFYISHPLKDTSLSPKFNHDIFYFCLNNINA